MTHRLHALSIDVEDYYNVFARDRLGIERPPGEAAVRATEAVLDLLAEFDVRATFFVLGEVAEVFVLRGLIRRIAEAGHEVGLHGYAHRQLFRQTPEEFRQDIRRCRRLVEEAAAQQVLGHRAAAFSLGSETQWALEVLAEEGITYDSSIFPILGRRYGWPGFARGIHRRKLGEGRSIIEAPLSTVRVLGRDLPACGGGYLRHFPYAYTRWAMRRIQRHRPAVVYLHPYEMDTEPEPDWFRRALATAAPGVRRFHLLQRRGRQTVGRKLRRLLGEFDFAPLRAVIEQELGEDPMSRT